MNTNLDLLHIIYDAQRFHQNGADALDIVTKYFQQSLASEGQAIPYERPQEMLDYWQAYDATTSHEIYTSFLSHSIKLHHTKYMGHQVVPPAPDTAIASMVGAAINNGGAVYEMGMSSNALERVVIERLLPYFGYDTQGGGLMTSGGTLANLTALLAARAVKGQGVWTQGNIERYGFMVSAEAHYCIDRAVRIMGWGDEGMVKVPVNDAFRMDTTRLEEIYTRASQKGIKIIGIVGSAPTTSTGIHDDLVAIGEFAQAKGLWFHVDGAHGGPAVFSEKYRHLMQGCHLADSITVDGHKMMMLPALTTLLLFKHEHHSYHTFNQEAHYLWGDKEYEWWNAGKRTFECTKLIMSLRFYILLQQYGIAGFTAFVEQCYDNAGTMAKLIQDHPRFEMPIWPDTNIVCFRPKGIEDVEGLATIRRQILAEGDFYIVQTSLMESPWLRVSLMNPFTSLADMAALLAKVESLMG